MYQQRGYIDPHDHERDPAAAKHYRLGYQRQRAALETVCAAWAYTAPECMPGRAWAALQEAGALLRETQE